jgi:hypothetical protein
MNKILQIAAVGVVLLACALFAATQTGSKSITELTDGKAVTTSERASGADSGYCCQ